MVTLWAPAAAFLYGTADFPGGTASRHTSALSFLAVRRVDLAELPAAAAEQAARTGWAKVIADWMPGDDQIPAGVLRAVVAAVHALGRVAVHSQHPAGGAAAVEARVDSLEHGTGLDPALLGQMAEQGTAPTPTMLVIAAGLAKWRQRVRSAGGQITGAVTPEVSGKQTER